MYEKHSLSTYWPVIDGHADTIVQAVIEGRSFFHFSNLGHLDLPRLLQAGVDLQVLAICAGTRREPYQWVNRILDHWEEEYLASSDRVIWLRSREDFLRWEREKKPGVLLGLEGGEPLENDPGRLEALYNRGIRIFSLTWNHRNMLACGTGCPDDHGLTLLGKETIRLAEKLKILLDLSHLAPRSFREAIFFSQKPVFVSHANIYELCPHPRNLTEEQVKAVAETGGTIGLTFYPSFIFGKKNACCRDLLLHLEYLLDKVGEKHIALGGDLDGIDQTLLDLREVRDLPNLVATMRSAGIGEQVTGQILGGNLYRLFKKSIFSAVS